MDRTLELYEWFDTNREKIIKGHHGKIALIHNNSVEGYFDSFSDALDVAESAGLEDESYVVQECITIDEELAQSVFLGYRIA